MYFDYALFSIIYTILLSPYILSRHFIIEFLYPLAAFGLLFIFLLCFWP